MSVVVLGYHEMGVMGLGTLIARGVPVAAVFTYEDDPKENCWFRSVAELARSHGIPTYTTTRINDPEWVEKIRSLSPDVIFSFYYRHIVKKAIREIPRFGCVNLHGSLLPRYRGRSPVNWQVLNGETESGVTLHHMVARADAGDVVGRERVEVGPDDTALDLYRKLLDAGRRLLLRHLDGILSGTAPREVQDESQATVFGGRKPEDGRIDWRRSAKEIHDLVRAVAPPWPGAFTDGPRGRLMVLRTKLSAPASGGSPEPGRTFREGDRLFAGTGDGWLQILELTDAEGEPVTPAAGEALGEEPAR